MLELLEGGWLEVDDGGMLDEDWLLLEDGNWLLELADGEVLDVSLEEVLDVSLEVELDGLDGLLELPMLLDDEDGLELVLELDDGDALEVLEPDWPHLSIAAWVFGPRMPSIGPGLQPCAFSCCCCSRTDSSPLALALAPGVEAEALVEAFASVELDGIELADEPDGIELDDELEGDCEVDGDCELPADCELLEALEDGGVVLEEDWDCAYAEPAASSAAMAMASFLEVIWYSFPVGWEVGGAQAMAIRGRARPARDRCKRCACVRLGFEGLARARSFRTQTST